MMQHGYPVEIFRIILASEDPQLRKDFRRCIEKHEDIKLAEISTLEEAADMVAHKKCNLVVMDAVMGATSQAPEVVEAVRNVAQMPVVFIANPEEKGAINNLHLDHVVGYLAKPIIDNDIDNILFALRYIHRQAVRNRREELSCVIPDSYLWRLRRLGYEMALVEERSRRRIAFDLHNNVGQCLSLVKMKIRQLYGPDEKSDETCEDLLNLIDQINSDTHYLISELSPTILYDLGLKTAIKWLADQISETHGLNIQFTDYTFSDNDHDPNNILLFRSVRELLENVVKHAQANRVNVCLYTEAGYQVISVEDNGVGFADRDKFVMTDSEGALGLFSMQEIIFYLGGRVQIDTTPGRGAKVSIFTPLKQHAMARSIS